MMTNNSGFDENEMMMNAQMMRPKQGPPNFKALFKSEKESYDLVSYKFGLDDVEDAFLLKANKL